MKGDSEELPEVVDSDQAQLFRSTSEKESLNSNERFLFHGAGIESIASIVEVRISFACICMALFHAV